MFMNRALADDEVAEFHEPEGIVRAKVCEQTGLLASPECTMTREEIFREGFLPKSYCEIDRAERIEQIIRWFDRKEKEYLSGKFRGG
jgi:membrane carboxypeptidase/penicillin-binding protein